MLVTASFEIIILCRLFIFVIEALAVNVFKLLGHVPNFCYELESINNDENINITT